LERGESANVIIRRGLELGSSDSTPSRLLLQYLSLCLYSELLTELQSLEPEFFHVIRLYTDFVPESYRLASFAAYHRAVKRALQEAVDVGAGDTILNRSAIPIFAGGGKNAIVSGVATIICHS
jgi:hypothetical protein